MLSPCNERVRLGSVLSFHAGIVCVLRTQQACRTSANAGVRYIPSAPPAPPTSRKSCCGRAFVSHGFSANGNSNPLYRWRTWQLSYWLGEWASGWRQTGKRHASRRNNVNTPVSSGTGAICFPAPVVAAVSLGVIQQGSREVRGFEVC